MNPVAKTTAAVGVVDILAELAAQTSLILWACLDGVETRQVDNGRPDSGRRRATDDADSHQLLQLISTCEQRLATYQLTQNTPGHTGE